MPIAHHRPNGHSERRRRLPLFAVVGGGAMVALAAVATPAMAARPGAPIVEAQQAVAAGVAPDLLTSRINHTAVGGAAAVAPLAAAAVAQPAAAAAVPVTAAPAVAAPAAAAAPAPAVAPAPAPAPAPTHSSPVPGARLTAHFGDGGTRWASGAHTGLDFAAPHGTPVKAVAEGTVTSTGWAGPYGLRAVVKHADGTSSTYNHLSRLATTGGHVSVGQTVGYLGSTGNSTGPHLHLEIATRQGTLIDPLTWLRDKGVTV
ncbi:MAG: M23 family metallopeptidase [Catenulispora sp.]|nr:M23 family metallopeptidase [Catenulispora sp.]